jgi:hypothetical protein
VYTITIHEVNSCLSLRLRMQKWLGQDKFLSTFARPPSGPHADEEHRTITQVCEMLLYEGVEAYKKEGPKFMQRLVAKQKARVKDS